MKRGIERLLQLGVLLLPLACWPNLPHPFSTPKTWLLGALALCGLAAVAVRGPEVHRPAPAGDWMWLVWPAALAASALTASFAGFDALLLAALPLPLAWAVQRGAIRAAMLRQALLWGSALESAVVCLQYCGLDPLQWMGWQPESFAGSRMRVYGTMGNPDFAAAWLCATLPLFAGTRGVARAGVALQLAAIFATGSRVSLLALPVGALAMWLGNRRPIHRSAAVWCVAGLAVAVSLAWLSPARTLGETVQGRWYLTRVATSHWRDIPVAGFGPGSFAVQFAGWQTDWLRGQPPGASEARFAGPVDHGHNDYVELWVEYGPLGWGAFLALSVWLAAGAWHPLPRRYLPADTGVRGAVACLAAMALVDFPFHRPAEWGLYWILLAVLSLGRKGCIDECEA
ncbi:MAG: O-antigen ligase family protein [Candidatus Solibacter sp.]|nr:O-antigen ligase family protein [Candidatus Solibacter sp.]